MMHISFFIGDMVSGGAERVIQLLANDFVQGFGVFRLVLKGVVIMKIHVASLG